MAWPDAKLWAIAGRSAGYHGGPDGWRPSPLPPDLRPVRLYATAPPNTRPLTSRGIVRILIHMNAPARVAVAYSRVSTSRQAEEGVSLEAQETRIRSWAAGQGMELVAVYADAGISGKRADNRPGLQAALTEVCKRRGVLVVYSLSRMARSTKDALEIAERLRKSGANLASLTENIDTSSPAGEVIFTVFAAFAQFERRLISERTRAAMDHLRRQGRKVSGNVPFGWEEAEGGRLVANEREQAVLVLIRKMRDSGASFRDIVRTLEADGIPTKSGLLVWTPATIRGVLLRDERLRMAA